MSCLTTSATRRSWSVPAAVLIASAAASSHDVLLVPMISVTLYTLITLSLDHARPRCGAAAASLSHRHPARSANRQVSAGRALLTATPAPDRHCRRDAMIFAADRWSTRDAPSLRNHDRCRLEYAQMWPRASARAAARSAPSSSAIALPVDAATRTNSRYPCV